tara:strand:+ start:88 stop:645 length:558 start_codon:yes stop_codon:yes gene_type:complete
MIKFFGLLSKKKKVKPETTASIFVALLKKVVSEGFIEIKDFINNNNNLESNPELKDTDIDWFLNVVFLGNIKILDLYFEDEEVTKLRALILDEIYKDLETTDQHLAIERFLDYENYFKDLLAEHEYPINAMAHAIFDKYNINNFQGDLFKKKNVPNPIFFNELKNLLNHFLWNWKDYLEKNKLRF